MGSEGPEGPEGSQEPGEPGEVGLRPATGADLPALAEVMLASRRAAYPAMPASVHTDDEVRDLVAGWDLTTHEVWLGEHDDDALPVPRAVAFVAVVDDWVDHLFVRPDVAGQGIGSALLDLVKALRPGGFGLWVFASNTAARSFYARHGLVEGEVTDGSDNEERCPDLRMTWPGRSSAGPQGD